MIVNSAQKCLVYAGYYLNTPARVIGRGVEWMTRTEEHQTVDKVSNIASITLALPFAIASFLPVLLCWVTASLVGSGRIELIGDFNAAPFAGRELRIMSNNSCLQDPWAPLTGGVRPPFEQVKNCANRIEALVNAIQEENVDVFFGQEFESLGAQDEAIERLKKIGFTHFARDLGATEHVRNNSGTFAASKHPFSLKFFPYAIEDREGLAKWSGQGAMVVEMGPFKFINVHLNYGEGPVNQGARNRQLTNYVVPRMNRRSVLFGDLNFNTATVDPQTSGLAGYVNLFEGQISCTDEGKGLLRSKPEHLWEREAIDGLVYDPNGDLEIRNPRLKQLRLDGELLTDHSAGLATVALKA